MKKLIKYLFFYIIYITFLSICYSKYLTDVYGYYGFKNLMTPSSFFASLVILIFVFFYVYKLKSNSYSKLIVYILVLINFVPSVITFCFMPISFKYLVLLVTYWGMFIFFIHLFNKIHMKTSDKIVKSNMINVYLVLLLELVVVFVVLFRYTGFNLDFNDVYVLRENYFQSNVPLILAYLFAAFKVINPLLFIYFYIKKNRFACFISLAVQILAFLSDGSKSTLFSILIAYIVVEYVKRKKTTNFLENDNLKFYLLLGLASINVIGFLEYILFDSSVLYTYFIRRLFFIPSLLNQCYFDFFSNNVFDLFRQSFLGKLGFISPYDMQIQKIISFVYFNTPNMLANNGLFSDAYMNLGPIGTIIMPFLLSFALRMLDHCAKGINPFYLITILISVSYVFLSSSFFTVLLTHGYLLLCIILSVIIPRETKEI